MAKRKKMNPLAKYLMDHWEDEVNVDGDMYETEVDIAIRLLERYRRTIELGDAAFALLAEELE